MASPNLLDKILQSAPGRIFVAALQTVLTSQLLLLTILVGRHVDILLLKYTIVLAVGLMAGFSSRRFLAGHTRLLVLLSGFLSAALSLATLYILSGGFLGINLINRLNQSPDWHGLIQLVVAALGTWLAGTAFRKKPITIEETAIAAPPPALTEPRKSWLPKIRLPQKKTQPARIVAEKEKPKTRTAQPKKKSSSALKPLPVSLSPGPQVKKSSLPVKKAARKKRGTKPEIKFVGTETYTCPYCLDEVKEHDPRGVKICPICKTRHHADCWGITGACQIPHSNSKK